MRAVTSIMRAHQILMGRLNEALAPFNLTFPRYEALMLLVLQPHGLARRSERWATASRSTAPA